MKKFEYPPLTDLFTRCVICDTIKDDAYFKQQHGRRIGLVCRECSNKAKRVIKVHDEYKQFKMKQKLKEYYTSWYNKNKLKVLLKSKEKYEANREKFCIVARERYKNNKELYKENNRLWRLNNPRATTAYVRQYNLAKMNRTPVWVNIKEINKFYRKCPIGLQVDHKHPLQGKFISGFHVLENLQYLTKEANTTKSNIFYPYWVTYESTRIRVETSGPEASIFSIVR